MSRITNDLDSVDQLFDKGLYPAINSVFTLIITTVLMFIVSWQLSIAVVLIAPRDPGADAASRRATRARRSPCCRSAPARSTARPRSSSPATAPSRRTGSRTLAVGQARAAQRRGPRGRRQGQLRRAHRDAAVVDAVEPRRRARRARRRLAVDAGARSTSARSRSFFIFARMFARPLNQFAQILNMALQASAGATGCSRSSTRSPRSSTAPDAHDVDHGRRPRRDGPRRLLLRAGRPDPARRHRCAAKPGQKIGLVGPTGAGKSTIINVITRYYDIQAGDIRLDDASIYDVDAGEPARARRHGAAGAVPLLRHRDGEHPLRAARGDRRGVHRGGQGGQRRRLHRTAARRLRDRARRRRLEPQPGPAAADHDRAHHPRQPAGADPRRGDLERRHPHREGAPGGAHHDDEGPHQLRDRPPAVDHPRLGRDRRDQRRPRRRRRQPRRADGRARLLPRPLHEPVPRRRHARRDHDGRRSHGNEDDNARPL